MPSLDALLFTSTANAALYSPAAAPSNSLASPFSFAGNGSSPFPQSNFNDALQSAWNPAAPDNAAPAANPPSTDQNNNPADQASWQKDQADRTTEKSARSAARARRNRHEPTSTAQNQSAADPAAPNTPPHDHPDADSSLHAAQTAPGNAPNPSAAPSAADQSAAASTQTAPANPLPAPLPATAPDTTSAAQDPASAKIQPHELPPASPANQPANATQPPPIETLGAAQGTDPDNPDAPSQDGFNAKSKPAATAFQPPAKSAAKLTPQDDAPSAASPQATPPSPPPAAPSTAPALAAAVTPSAAGPLAAAPDPAKAPAPAPSPTVLTATTTAPAAASTDRADPAAPAQQLPQDQQDPTFDQVVMGLRGKLDPRNGKAEIHLDPPNLGTLHVSLTLTNGSLTAQFQSSSDVVRNLLSAHMEKLKNALESQGVAVGKIAVEPPASQTEATAAKSPAASPSQNDGRSAGQYSRDPQPGQRRSPGSGASAQSWTGSQARSAPQNAPLDLVA